MKDFDTGRKERRALRLERMGDRQFKLGGETFTYRDSVSYTVLEKIAASADDDGADLIRVLERAVIELLEDGQEERVLAVLHSTTDPFTFEDLNELVSWLTEVQSGRPTLASSPSTAGDAETETSSTEDSSSRPAVASAA